MNLLRTCLLAVAIIAFTASCSKDESVEEPQRNVSADINLDLVHETDWVMANEILNLINEHRATLGLDPIRGDKQYASAYAVEHTKYMMEREEISHDNFAKRSNALKDKGAKGVGENVAFGYRTAEQVVNAWMHSDAHREIIEGNYTHSGFGVIPNHRGSYYFTQLFYRK